MQEASEHSNQGVRHRRALWYLGLGLLGFVGLAAFTVWGLSAPGNASPREAAAMLAVLWMLLGPAVALIVADFCLSWVEMDSARLRARFLWRVRTLELDRVRLVQVTPVGFRLRDAGGKTLAEVPHVTRGYKAMLKQVVQLPGVRVEGQASKQGSRRAWNGG